MILLETEPKRRPFEASYASHRLDALMRVRECRNDRVSAIRRAIADGTYETPEKIDLMLHRLIEDLRSDA